MKDRRSRWNRIQNILLILLPILILLSLAYTAVTGRAFRQRNTGRDTTPPSLLLTRDENYFVLPGEMYEEEGYAAYDDRDGDLTKKVEVSVSGDMVRYRVQDEAGNITIRFRKIPRISAGKEP
ncbi:MAG: hypothetical protein Q4D81_11240 [Eubacteriales bacterium]|nr:hypothetical protein [Eubacteriales bacterium]